MTGYADLARKYRISAVPQTVIGESQGFVGFQPESVLLKQVQDAAAASTSGIVV